VITRAHAEGPDAPYLSVVVTARNDDHGGNPIYRTQLFVDGLIAQCDRFHLPAELLFVEWNPPADRPRLADVLEWPESDGWCSVRFIEVPAALHDRLEHADRLPLFQMIGKNVGIRRARAPFVLATNIDILFSDSLMRMIAGRGLRQGHLYRVNRYDVPADIDRAWPLSRQLKHCGQSVYMVNAAGGTLDIRNRRFYWIYPEWRFVARLLESRLGSRFLSHPTVHRVVDLRLGRLQTRLPRLVAPALGALLAPVRIVRLVWRRMYALAYWAVAGFAQPRKVPARLARRLRRTARALRPARGTRLRHYPAAIARLGAKAAHIRFLRWQEEDLRERARVRLHTNASGDFTLLAKEDWERVRGYAELEMYSMHIDGLFLYQAHYHGIREHFLHDRVFHIEHGGGFRPDAKGDESLDAQLEKRALPQLSTATLVDWLVEMYETQQPKEFNDDSWGFAGVDLPETEVSLPRRNGNRRLAATVAVGSGERKG
jgi:hypothetical protein